MNAIFNGSSQDCTVGFGVPDQSRSRCATPFEKETSGYWGFVRHCAGTRIFSLTANFDRWTEAGVEFDFGIDANPSFVKRADGLPEGSWKELERPRKGQGRRRRQRRAKVKPEIVQARGFKRLTLEREEIAEMDYRPSKAEGTYRLLVLRKTILVEKGQKRLLPQRRYHFYVTNIPAAQAWNLKAWMGMVLPAPTAGQTVDDDGISPFPARDY